MADIITKVIGDERGWYVVEYDPAYPIESTRIIRNLATSTGDYPTKEEAQAAIK